MVEARGELRTRKVQSYLPHTGNGVGLYRAVQRNHLGGLQ
jgi:hypothetical protein